MQHSQLSRGRTRQDHPDHAGKCQQQLVREFPLLRKRVGQRLKARRLFQSLRSATSQRQVWHVSEQQIGRDGRRSGLRRNNGPHIFYCYLAMNALAFSIRTGTNGSNGKNNCFEFFAIEIILSSTVSLSMKSLILSPSSCSTAS